jgi:hypothetical protein
MARRSPNEYFIKYLISQNKHETNTILRILEDFNLDGLTSGYVRDLTDQMGEFPDPYKPNVKSHKMSQGFLRKHKVRDLWFPSPHVQEAYAILSNAQLRSDIEQLLLSPLRIEDIVRRAGKAREISLSVEGVEAFGHYFWNKSLLSMDEWVDYLENRHNAPPGTVHSSVTALQASPDMAELLVPWVVGLEGVPKDLNTGVVHRRIRDSVFLKFLEVERQPASLAHSKMLKNYMDVIRAAEAEMRQSDVALKDVLKEFEKFRMRKEVDEVPSIEEVAGPNFSHSGEGDEEDKVKYDNFEG